MEYIQITAAWLANAIRVTILLQAFLQALQFHATFINALWNHPDTVDTFICTTHI